MKTATQLLTFLIIAVMATNCANYSGTGYHSTIVGTNHKHYKQSATEVSWDDSNQSLVANKVLNSVTTIASAWIAFKSLIGLSNNSTKEVLGEQATTRSIAAGKEATKVEKEVTKRILEKPVSTALP